MKRLTFSILISLSFIGNSHAQHPRLFFGSGDIEHMRTLAEGELKELAAPILAFADDSLDGVAPHTSPPTDNLNAYRYAGYQLIAFAFAWVISNEDKYLELTKKYMDAYNAWECWGDEGTCGTPGLGHAGLLLGTSIAYDWIYNDLSQEEQDRYREMIIKRADEMYRAADTPVYVDAWNNWWNDSWIQNHHSTKVSVLGLAALALDGESGKTAAWLVLADEHMRTEQGMMNGMADGSWHESIGYQGYKLNMMIPFLYNYKKIKGVDLYPHTYFENYIYWRTYNIIPGTWKYLLHYGDYGWSWHDNYGKNLMRFMAHEYQNGYAQQAADYIAGQTGRYGDVWTAPWVVYEFLFYDTGLETKPLDRLPLHRFFPDLTGAIWRSGWDEQSTALAYKTGIYGGQYAMNLFVDSLAPFVGGADYNVGHDHDDFGSFYLARNGKLLMPETVTYEQVESKYHNVVEIDGQTQYRPNTEHVDTYDRWAGNSSSYLHATSYTENYGHVCDYLTPRYQNAEGLNEYQRHLLFVKPDIVLIADKLSSDKEHTYKWIGHFGDNAVLSESEGVINVSFDDGQHLQLIRLAPANSTWARGDDGQPYVHIAPQAKTAHTTLLHLISMGDSQAGMPVQQGSLTAATDAASLIGFQNRGKEAKLIVAYDTTSVYEIGPYSSDASALYLEMGANKQVQSGFISRGSIVRDTQAGQTLFEARGEIVFTEWQVHGDSLIVESSGNSCMKIYAPAVSADKVYTTTGQQLTATADSGMVDVCGNLSAKPEGSAYELHLFPIPAKGLLHIESSLPIEKIELIDQFGLVESLTNPQYGTIDLSAYPAGVYYLRAQGNGRVVVKKIIILR